MSGGARPESWRYEVELPLPSGKVSKRTLPADAVLHVRYATRPAAPWAGISPLGMAAETRALATWIEKRLAEEASTVTFPTCSHSPRAATWTQLKADIKGWPWAASNRGHHGGGLGRRHGVGSPR